jgi:hypothetical protein
VAGTFFPNDDVDPTNFKELFWAFAMRCHPFLGEAVFADIGSSLLLAYLRQSENISSTSGKINLQRPPAGRMGGGLADPRLLPPWLSG